MINDSPKWAVFILERIKHGKIFLDGNEIGVHGLFHIERVNITLKAGNIFYPIVAKPVEGYTFAFWLSSATTGWIGSTYIDTPTSSTTNIWISYPNGSALDAQANGVNIVSAFAVYIKNSVA